MDTTLSVILFLAPGLLAVRISQALDPEYKDRTSRSSEIESTVFAVLSNIPGILVGWLLWSAHYHKNLRFDEWTAKLADFPGALTYVLVSFFLALLVEWKLKPKVMKRVAERRASDRTSRGLPSFDSSESWEVFIGVEEELCMRISSLTNNSNVVTGMIDAVFRPDESSQGITLLHTDELALVNDKLVSPIRTYFDSKTGIKYELFDIDAVKEAYKEPTLSS